MLNELEKRSWKMVFASLPKDDLADIKEILEKTIEEGKKGKVKVMFDLTGE